MLNAACLRLAANGPVGAAVVVLAAGQLVALHGEERFPMQSVHKFPIAMAVLARVDHGLLALERSIDVARGDLVPTAAREGVIAAISRLAWDHHLRAD